MEDPLVELIADPLVPRPIGEEFARPSDIRYPHSLSARPRVRFWPDVPAEIAMVAAPLVDRYLFLLPPTIREVWVYYDPSDQGTARVNVQDEYRTLKLTLGPQFLSHDDRDQLMVHEFMHCYTCPVSEACEHALLEWGEGHVAKALAETVRRANEAATTDLTELVVGLLRRIGADNP